MKLKTLKLTQDVHEHLEKMELFTFNDLEKEIKKQRAEILERHKGTTGYFCMYGCSDCEDVYRLAKQIKEK